MSTGAILAIVIPALVILAFVVVFAVSRRRDLDEAEGQLSRETVQRDRARAARTPADASVAPVSSQEVEKAAVVARREADGELVVAGGGQLQPWVPPDEEQIGVSRRQFFNRSIVGLMGFGIASFGAASVAFLWPKLGGGFGSAITIGSIPDLRAQIQANNGFLYFPEARMWLTEYPASALKKAEQVYTPPVLEGMRAGVVASYQKCPHLGCRVPECASSQWFECPCHGSQYNQVGEKRAGPAPRGMDHFAMGVSDDLVLTVDTGTIIGGAPIGVDTTGQEAEGPHCIGQATHE